MQSTPPPWTEPSWGMAFGDWQHSSAAFLLCWFQPCAPDSSLAWDQMIGHQEHVPTCPVHTSCLCDQLPQFRASIVLLLHSHFHLISNFAADTSPYKLRFYLYNAITLKCLQGHTPLVSGLAHPCLWARCLQDQPKSITSTIRMRTGDCTILH